MQKKDTLTQLSNMLTRQVEQAEHLLALLGDEYLCLQSTTPDELEALLKRKQICLLDYEKLETQRQTITDSMGISSFNDYLRKSMQSADPQMYQSWSRLSRLANECQHQNMINGTLAELGRQRAESCLQALHGQDNSRDVYRKNGGKEKPSPTQKLAIA